MKTAIRTSLLVLALIQTSFAMADEMHFDKISCNFSGYSIIHGSPANWKTDSALVDFNRAQQIGNRYVVSFSKTGSIYGDSIRVSTRVVDTETGLSSQQIFDARYGTSMVLVDSTDVSESNNISCTPYLRN